MAHSSKGFLILCMLILVAGCNGSSPSAPELSLAVEPSSATAQSGQSLQFTATGGDGGTAGASWSSSNPAVATIDGSGKLTTGFSAGRTVITARAGAAVGRGEVNVVRACANPIAIAGDPGPSDSIASEFEVRFDPSEDAARLTAEFAALYGFTPLEIFADGFRAALTTAQINSIVCRSEVASITFG